MSIESTSLSRNFKIECKIGCMESLTVWMLEELNRRNWNPADLAKASGMSTGALSNIMNGKRKPGPKTLKAIARALGEPLDKIFRLAGLLLPEAEKSAEEDDLLYIFRQLSKEQKQIVMSMFRGLQGRPPASQMTIIPSPVEPDAQLFPGTAIPSLQEIIDLAEGLDEFERWLVYDCVRWRLEEQERRRNSSGEQVTGWLSFEEVLRAVEKLSPSQRELLLGKTAGEDGAGP